MKTLLVGLTLAVLLPRGGATPPSKVDAQLGSVAVGKHAGQVLIRYPAEDGKSYRIDVVISRPADLPPIKAERIDVWLLARGGKAVPLRERPRPGALVESVLGRGASADAIFLFAPAAPYAELSGVVVSVDGQLKTFRLPAGGPRSSDRP
jgi:hypothetical protein